MATLRVRRKADSAGVFRRMLIEVDGEVVARLLPNEQQAIQVGPGRHVVRARMDWTASPPVEVHVDGHDTVHLETSLPWTALFAMVTRPRSALLLHRI